MFDTRPISISLGNLAEAAGAGVALALEARATVAAVQSPTFPSTTTGMYPPEPSWEPSAAQRPTVEPWTPEPTTIGLMAPEPTWEPSSAAVQSPIRPPILIGLVAVPNPLDPSSPSVQ